jgi:mono/diheme cytochrome c family protein
MSVLKTAIVATVVFSFFLMTGSSSGQQSSSGSSAKFNVSGGDLFKTYCASCHGRSGKGDGPLAEHMKKRPPDLTLFSQENGGVFPSAKVAQIIDGRNPLAGHGGPDMPVWGNVFKASSQVDSDAAVQARIDALVAHLESIQQKSAENRPDANAAVARSNGQ